MIEMKHRKVVKPLLPFWKSRAAPMVAATILGLLVILLTAGCATPGRLVNQLAKQGDFERVEIVTRKGERIRVMYRGPAVDRWMDGEE